MIGPGSDKNRLNNLTLFQMLSSNNIITFLITRIQPLWEGNDFCWWFQVCKGSKNDTKNLLWYFPAILYLVSPGVFREEAITVQMVFVAEAENNCASSASLLHRADEQWWILILVMMRTPVVWWSNAVVAMMLTLLMKRLRFSDG